MSDIHAIGVKERPILFSGAMVNAILDGRKTQTRRVIKVETGQPKGVVPERMEPWVMDGDDYQQEDEQGRLVWIGYHPDFPTEAGKWFTCAYGAVGQRLWVREAFAIVPRTAYRMSEGVHRTDNLNDPFKHDAAVYRAGWTRSEPGLWKPSIHMPRWASRILLEITSVRAEQVQRIHNWELKMEGLPPATTIGGDFPVWTTAQFRDLWDSINAKRNGGAYSWARNPFVWVIEFKVVTP